MILEFYQNTLKPKGMKLVKIDKEFSFNFSKSLNLKTKFKILQEL